MWWDWNLNYLFTMYLTIRYLIIFTLRNNQISIRSSIVVVYNPRSRVYDRVTICPIAFVCFLRLSVLTILGINVSKAMHEISIYRLNCLVFLGHENPFVKKINCSPKVVIIGSYFSLLPSSRQPQNRSFCSVELLWPYFSCLVLRCEFQSFTKVTGGIEYWSSSQPLLIYKLYYKILILKKVYLLHYNTKFVPGRADKHRGHFW